MTKKEESDFGKGFVYNLVLFAKHWEGLGNKIRLYEEMRTENPDLFREESAVQLWFNGSSDHFYEFEVPEQYKNTTIGRLAKKIQEKALDYGHGNGFMTDSVTLKDAYNLMADVERLCMMIDKKLGVKDIKATWN